ncbi:carbamoyltransferase HypF [Nonomuraea sp. NPDC048916]|uniref:carbamoyltransferase HypF n=1 Tax=Nonomuraea sp. NPDC048916 TaxID=3154232 RepID=UPI0034113627
MDVEEDARVRVRPSVQRPVTGSEARQVRDPLRDLPSDQATCAGCLRELFDPANRRYRYAFIDCASCGPRAAIIESLPYVRDRTTMRHFPMCAACGAEYHDPAGRRFHAESIACASCGPRLRFLGITGDPALRAAIEIVAGGGVIAVKGPGGFQIMCDAIDDAAVARFRELTGRPAEPLPVMVRDVTGAGALGVLTEDDRRLLGGPSAPIVLVPRRRHAVLSTGVCAGTTGVGLLLPGTPLHHLLLDGLRRPLVVVAADDSIGSEDAAALGVDGVLTHDRPVVTCRDDSVVRSLGSRSTVIRRARGLADAPLPLPVAARRPLVAMGAARASTFTLADGERAILGPHLGDLTDARALEAYEGELDRLGRLHGIEPVHAAHDLDPGCLSSRLARRWPSRVAVQHHHAHVAAVAAEHALEAPFLGVAYDGLGLGDDGTFWGGELLLATYTGYRRLGRFSHAPMPGGAAALHRPARMALGYLVGGETTGKPIPMGLAADLPGFPAPEAIRQVIARGAPVTSGAGSLFDAAAALLGLCAVAGFEGEAAMRLEQAAAGSCSASLPVSPPVEPLAWRLARRDGLWVYDAVATLRDLLEARADGEPVGRIAAAFHATIAAVTVLLCERAAAEHDVTTVCLSGGVFQNRLLAADVLARLTLAGFEPYIGERVPVDDGGVSYGQAAIAAARLAMT